jgi:hypothetical protein
MAFWTIELPDFIIVVPFRLLLLTLVDPYCNSETEQHERPLMLALVLLALVLDEENVAGTQVVPYEGAFSSYTGPDRDVQESHDDAPPVQRPMRP